MAIGFMGLLRSIFGGTVHYDGSASGIHVSVRGEVIVVQEQDSKLFLTAAHACELSQRLLEAADVLVRAG